MFKLPKNVSRYGASYCRSFSDNYGILPDSARVVIAGSGVVANSVAYHLTKNGWKDILILEQNTLQSGTSQYCTGLIGLFKPEGMRRVILESVRTYIELEQQGYDVGLRQCGSIAVAQTQDRMIALKRRMSYNKPNGLNCEFVTPEQIKEIHPYLNVDDLRGGIYVPEDSVADPTALSNALIDIAKKSGVKYREQCQVQLVQIDSRDKIVGVETNSGIVKCEYFVNCAGMWSRDLGLKCKKPVRIPAYAAEHYYAITSGMELPIDKTLPCIRDYDSASYNRQFNRELLIGWFEPEARSAFIGKGKVPQNWMKNIREDLPHFDRHWDIAIQRLPSLQNQSPYVSNTPDSFTPDGRWILGESPEVENYYVAVGTNGNSIQGAGGIGKAVAEWMIEGRPTQELSPFSIQRFIDVHNNRQFLEQRVKEVVGYHYSVPYPNKEYKYGRKLRCSPLYSVLEQRRAVFGTVMAYERALYFDTTHKRGGPLPKLTFSSFFKPKFFEFLQNEYHACRDTVGVIDISSFSKIKIKSSNTEDVVSYLQRVCCNDVDIPIGTCIKTGMLNRNGGYENECIIIRLTDNSFFMVSPSSQQTRIYEWMENHLPSTSSSIKLSDQTSMYTVINVIGPKSLMLMSELSNSDVDIPPFRYKKVNVGYASDVMLMSYTHTGEPGYCLYVPSEYALHLYEEIMKLGIDYGAKDCGTMTQKFMRIERFIPLMGDELNSFVTPLEAGLENHVNFDKVNFIGKAALMKQKQDGIRKRLVMLLLEDHNIDENLWAWGREPIYRNDEFVGTVTSAGYGFTSDKIVCLGFIRNSSGGNVSDNYIMDENAKYHVDIAGRLFTATPYTTVPLFFEQQEKEHRTASSSYRPSIIFNVKKQRQ
ncbi:CLUMA_CG020280, isoform A [Clunio marinus]|uniref:CLUMA_CG020280, isoform A n=1 Tax=Clunio marinus TaxID=568069 RepID=A0A1J1J4G7_9DIPT|nr:CLUMA_CG020280, isoform A [Clunio marinus]